MLHILVTISTLQVQNTRFGKESIPLVFHECLCPVCFMLWSIPNIVSDFLDAWLKSWIFIVLIIWTISTRCDTFEIVRMILCLMYTFFFEQSVFLQRKWFGIFLAVGSVANVPISNFVFHLVLALERHGVDVARDGILQNYVAKGDLVMNGKTPWRGPRKKSMLFMQLLIQATTLPFDVVLDCTAATHAISILKE